MREGLEAGRTGEIGRGELLGLPLHPVTAEELIDWLLCGDPTPRAAGYLNAHTFNLATRKGNEVHPLFRQLDLVYADGMSVVKATRRRGLAVPERVSAADFFLRFCQVAAERQRSIALVGGKAGLAEACAAHLVAKVPGLRIVHTSPGYFPTEAERTRLRAELQERNPDVVLLGMGTPAQEAMGLTLRDEDKLRVWCVGALFEYFTPGVRRHAPLWMRKAGLEWLFRLSQEPRRLAGRYLLGNLEFLWRTRGRR